MWQWITLQGSLIVNACGNSVSFSVKPLYQAFAQRSLARPEQSTPECSSTATCWHSIVIELSYDILGSD